MWILERRSGHERKTSSAEAVEGKMKKIKVLQMIDRSFLGGGQTNLLSLARFLDRGRFDIAVCSRGGGPLADTLREEGIPHFPIAFSKLFRKHIVKDLISLLNSQNFDILHTHGGVAGFYGRWSAHKCARSIRVVHTLHGIHYLHYRNFFLKHFFIYLERKLSHYSDAVIFVSYADREMGRRFQLVPESKQIVIKNGIDFKAFEAEALCIEKAEGLELDSSVPIVGTVARLHRQKGLPYLIKAAGRIREAIPDAKVWIVGGGSLFHKFRKLKKKLGLENTIQLLGERKDIAPLLSRFDVFVLPSLWEGLPYSLMEAAALARPVVATEIAGVAELIKHGETGLLVPVKDSNRLAHSVIRLLQEKEYAARLGQNLKNSVRQQYTLSQMVQKIQDLYLRLSVD
jgi:glycosyltransferase involved in cell wall biosynthesis